MEKDTKFLMKRRDYWYYQRRIPQKFVNVEGSIWVKKSLRTKIHSIAKIRRNALVKADETYWALLSHELLLRGYIKTAFKNRLREDYERAVSNGLSYEAEPLPKFDI